MGILDQIQLVEREFVPGNVLIKALMIQEGVSEFYVASWFLRNINELDCLQFLQFNSELRDFEILEGRWANDVFSDITANKNSSPEWFDDDASYIGGWLSSELKQFFSNSSLDYPEDSIAQILKSKPSTCNVENPSVRSASQVKSSEVEKIDPLDLPAELDAANMAFRAVTNGYGDTTTTPKNRLTNYLQKHYPAFKPEQVNRIATVANPDKSTGRKKLEKK